MQQLVSALALFVLYVMTDVFVRVGGDVLYSPVHPPPRLIVKQVVITVPSSVSCSFCSILFTMPLYLV